MAASAKTTLARTAAPFSSKGNHTAGIYADMTVDGPEIGTLVIVVDRAKNLPNLKTMGKQDPYCAARLAKEAKKTDTDRRGGQTPRWDQELRFVVRDSPDYHKLKVSVFNDDKKTDLIGETWVQLDHILRPGGGQADDWHHLNIKGRYAGEIRMELTFYDSRPKVEKPRERDRSNASSTQLERPPPFVPHRSDPLHRKPLPPEPAISTVPSLSDLSNSAERQFPQATSQGHGASFRQPLSDDPVVVSYGNYAPALRAEVQHLYPEPRSRPLPTTQAAQPADHAQSSYYQDPYSTQEEPFVDHDPILSNDIDGHMPFTDDPYALRAAEQQYDPPQDHSNPPFPTPPRHNRVETLSGTPNPRPSPPHDLLHTQSAPQFGSDEHISDQGPRYDTSRHHYPERHEFDFQNSYDYQEDDVPHTVNPSPSYEYSAKQWEQPLHLPDIPPPPPVHRNSAPPAPPSIVQPPFSRQTRPLHVPMNSNDAVPESWAQVQQDQPNYKSSPFSSQASMPSYSFDPYSRQPQFGNTPPRYSHSNGFQHHLSQSADLMISPRNEMASDPRAKHQPTLAETQQRPQALQNVLSQRDEVSIDPSTPHDPPYVAQSNPPAPVKPVAISPGSDRTKKSSQFHTPRKSVGSNQSPAESQTSTPYSPDSFDMLNPHHSNHSTPNTGGPNKDGPTPMYSPQSSVKGNVNPRRSGITQVEQPETPANQNSSTEGPIIGSDGRVKDPSDHLPPSSYAPEPERKGNRPTTVLNIKSRFGPREARPVNVLPSRPSTLPTAYSSTTATNLSSSPTDTHRKHLSGTNNLPSSPLSPTQSSVLNMNSGGFNLTSPYPPPVPGKIPLGTYQSQVDEHDHFEMAALSLGNDEEPVNDPKSSWRRRGRRNRLAMQ